MTHAIFRRRAICIVTALAGYPTLTQSTAPELARNRQGLFAVLGQSPGERKLYPRPRLVGKVELKDAQGRRQTSNLAAWDLLADIHVRFLFDAEDGYYVADLKELQDLGITSLPQALQLATENLHRESGTARVSEAAAGVLRVTGGQPRLNTGYFFDYSFWLEQLNLTTGNRGLAIAAPSRTDLLFCDATDFEAVDRLREESNQIYSATLTASKVSTAVVRLMHDGLSLLHGPT